MGNEATTLDITTLLIALAVVIFAVSLAQLVLLTVASFLKKKERQEREKLSGANGEDYLR